jgi:hypothetical protein
MEFNFNVTKEERKALVSAISEILGCEAIFQKAPSFAYKIGGYTVDRNGVLSFENEESALDLLSELQARGFDFEGGSDEFFGSPEPSDSESFSIADCENYEIIEEIQASENFNVLEDFQ